VKYYRMKNPHWDGKNPAYQWRIAVTIEEGGVEKFITLRTTNGQRHVETVPVADCTLVPAKYQLDKDEFHLLRKYIDCLSVDRLEKVTEEQIKAEETIDMNSGFDWLYEDRKESLRLDPTTGKSSKPSPQFTTLSSPGNPFGSPKANIFGSGTGIGTVGSHTARLGVHAGPDESIEFDSNGNAEPTEEPLIVTKTQHPPWRE